MILDLEKFISEQQGRWREFEGMLSTIEKDPSARMDMEKIKRFRHLYQRTSADLGRLQSFASEPELRNYLESLVARGFCEIHGDTSRSSRVSILSRFRAFPLSFRKHLNAFWLAVATTLAGILFGAVLISVEPEAKSILLPFDHLMGSPSDRVAKEEQGVNKSLEDRKVAFSSRLMTHNIRVAILCLAMGITFGIGTLILLFYNGVILGAIVLDYIGAGQTAFLVGWLLPHGSIEIPAFLIAGQAGLVLAGALLARRSGIPLGERLRAASADLTALICGTAVMLVWAGIIEAFFSQYHEPVLPYSLKIGFGAVELALLAFLLSKGYAKAKTTGE